PKYLSRLFKEKTGAGFNDTRLEIKIRMARKLLTSSVLPIHEIADKLGYKNMESFIRIFKKMTGHTPAAYRSTPQGTSRARSRSVHHS
ncbi:MAG: helix-turn-helix transcriptional regulator, partial [Candidatus Omnitrophica bacterium]|nr:helix-turn-helix transcriptional regulator [Candidatus Omnitrophota bacterium]